MNLRKKNLRKMIFFLLYLLIEHSANRVLVYQSTYKEKILKYFYINKTHPLGSSLRKDVQKLLNPKSTIL